MYKVLDYFIVVRWIETPVSSFSKVGFNWKISKEVGLAFSYKRLFDYVLIDKHIVELRKFTFSIGGSGLRVRIIEAGLFSVSTGSISISRSLDARILNERAPLPNIEMMDELVEAAIK